MNIVVDSSPLILLNRVGRIDLLPAIATRILVPRAVLVEIEVGASRDQTPEIVVQADWSTIVEPPSIPEEVSAWDLGAGETAVLAWAAAHNETTAVLDDLAARKCAEAIAVPAVGTLGIILAAREAGLIPAARPVLEDLLKAGYYLSDKVVATFLRTMGESGT